MVQASTSKLIDPPLYHIKGKSVMKTCWTDMPCNCWGKHWCTWCGMRSRQVVINMKVLMINVKVQHNYVPSPCPPSPPSPPLPSPPLPSHRITSGSTTYPAVFYLTHQMKRLQILTSVSVKRRVNLVK